MAKDLLLQEIPNKINIGYKIRKEARQL